ncbi:MAG: Ribonucleoside-diphosphate reductase NrdZ [candidate division WS6 bacterium OLB20]|uniref:Vitamin B12-dependent ribonucleotide reductase n=1 Tax=candidate division WS6 bacterium OLB20 TaxID=1617426 RepID=A0A136M0N6_9BACT|nr:MAG: Ribonucleoside-diphosphate reductase NrdZ [candidate division WS6 bacterium OLB20]
MRKRHLLKDDQGELLEEPRDMFWRVARSMALEDAKYVKGAQARKERVVKRTAREFYELLAGNRFLPGSRVLYEAGNEIDGTGQLSSCFVLPIEDSLESIFETMKEAAIVQKNNGGTGFNFSHIRPKGDSVGGTPNVAAGPVHFIRSFSQAFDQVLQGKKRGGGNMAILNVNHPDIIEFINLKGQDNSIRNFNISVGVTDEFMQAVKNDEEYDLINPRNGQAVKRLRAREVFDLICEKAWECADPGLFFLDTTQNANPTKPLGVIEATNPCGEEPLRAYESCNLGSIVLPTHLIKVNGEYQVDWELLRKSVRSATHFLDNMIDLSKFPLKKIEQEVEQTRKLGLGLVGLASMFYMMEIPYNSKEATDLTKEIMAFVQEEATVESENLAKDRGVFPGFKGSKWDDLGREVRNATMTSVAPTGTLSLVADTSSGIEPVFALVYKRSSFYQDEGQEERKQLLYVDRHFEAYAREHGFYSEDLMEKIAENRGSLHGLAEVPSDAQNIFVTTHDIEPDWHVKMQAAAQDSVDAAVSKTINLPNEATVDDVRTAYVQAWELGCKGITIYRDGSKQFQVLENVSKKEKVEQEEAKLDLTFNVSAKTHEEEHILTENAMTVLEKRALAKDDSGAIAETPDQLWRRIARKVASAEQQSLQDTYEEAFYQLMHNGEFYSGGTLLWAGMGEETILSKCLVLPVSDSIDSIFQTLNWNIQCLRRGVGTGFNFSTIRSSYAQVKTTGEFAAGPVEYLRMYNRAQDTIRGRGGRGLGSMAILNADHPNIEEFIESKDDLTAISHYNISVGVSDAFMKAVKNDEDWDLTDPSDGKVYKTVKARALFENIARHAWKSGDPGLFFVDVAERANTTPALGRMDATNPCGEQPLIPFETCNLGHINLARMIQGFPYAADETVRDWSFERKMELIDWDRLKDVTYLAVRFLDNIIDVNNYPIREIEEMTRKTRNVGVGVMGYTDMLIKLGISYGSAESVRIAEEVMSFIQDTAHEASQKIGEEKGSFPAFEESVWKQQGKTAMRNTRVTTIAPTGTISIVANVNPGIEPVFALGFRRKNSMGGTDQEVIDHQFETVARARGIYSDELMKKIADGAHLTALQEEFSIPADVVDVFVTTHEIDPEKHVQIQAAFQKYVDSAVSKTINLPKTASWQDIARVYQLAYDLGCKGITVFRDGSKDPALQVGTVEKKTEPAAEVRIEAKAGAARNSLSPRKRDEVVRGLTTKVRTEQGELFVTINEDDEGIVEVFLTLGKSGSYTAGYTEAVGRLVSMSLRSGIKPEAIIDQLLGIRTSAPTMNRGGLIVYSVPDAVAKVLKKHLEEKKNQIRLLPEDDAQTSKIEQVIAEVTTESRPLQPAKLETQEVIEEVIIQNSKPVAQTAPKPQPQVTVTEKKPEPVKRADEHLPAILSGIDTSKYSKQNTMGDLLECPDCAGDLEYAEGCILCRSCGYSKCG